MIYHPNGSNWLLYSIGPERVDDGGKSVGRTEMNFAWDAGMTFKTGRGDLLYDSPW